jgi:hypothetical protein
MTNDDPAPSVDGPTAMSPTNGHLNGGLSGQPTSPNAAEGPAGEAAAAEPSRTPVNGPTTQHPIGEPPAAEPAGSGEEPTGQGFWSEEPAGPTPANAPAAEPAHPHRPGDEPTSVDSAEPNPVEGPAVAPSPWALDDEPTIENLAAPVNGPTVAASGQQPVPGDDDPTIIGSSVDGPTVADFAHHAMSGGDNPTIADFAHQAMPGGDEATAAVVSDEPTTTGPTVGDWPLDQFEPPPPGELVWEPEAPPGAAPTGGRKPAYYVTLGAAVVLVVGLVALAAVVTVVRPRQEVAGSALAAVPVIGGGSSEAPQPTTTQPPPTSQAGPFAELAAHPLSSATTRMPDTTCALPRFDPADDRQAAFYQAAKVCADDAWRPVLQAAGLDADVPVVTLTAPVQTQTCGELTPTSPATECDGTVYLSPAYLRDTEQNGRYPGRYLGVFLREYARALQYATGLDDLVGKVTTGSSADLDTRVDQQATCLAGVVSGSMSGRGAIDGNITGEIHTRLSTVDAPADAQSWLDKGIQQRTPAACNTWG